MSDQPLIFPRHERTYSGAEPPACLLSPNGQHAWHPVGFGRRDGDLLAGIEYVKMHCPLCRLTWYRPLGESEQVVIDHAGLRLVLPFAVDHEGIRVQELRLHEGATGVSITWPDGWCGMVPLIALRSWLSRRAEIMGGPLPPIGDVE